MIGIIFATHREAKPFLESVQAICICQHPFLLFKVSKKGMMPCIVIISGIGKVVAAVATLVLIVEYDTQFILNVGICGALDNDLSLGIGGLYRISTAIEGDRFLTCGEKAEMFKSSPFFNGLSEASLVTSDRAVFDNDLKRKMSIFGELADMEGAAIARVCDMYNINYDIIKGVSDLADNDGFKIMESNLEKVSLNLAIVLIGAITMKY